jgi:hypothetical protein
MIRLVLKLQELNHYSILLNGLMKLDKIVKNEEKIKIFGDAKFFA